MKYNVQIRIVGQTFIFAANKFRVNFYCDTKYSSSAILLNSKIRVFGRR